MEEFQQIATSSRYTVYVNEDGKEFLVLNGLSIEDQFEPPPLQQFIHGHIDTFIAGYWALLIITASYLILFHLLWPLYERFVQSRK